MSILDKVEVEPFRHNFYRLLRELERNERAKPRIGDGVTLKDDIVTLSQDPFTAFPSSNIVGVDRTRGNIPRLSVRFLGMFGPQGALPLHLTETALLWSRRDPSFARFVDIFSTRFLQLFYRAWADARPIAQFERMGTDRFQAYLGSFGGVGTPVLRDEHERDPARRQENLRRQIARLPFAGLVNSHVKSAARLRQLLRGVFGIDVEISEWIGTWLPLDDSERTALGRRSSALGSDTILGKMVYTINERFRIRIRCRDLAEYESFLPGAPLSKELADLVFYYVGYRQDFEVELGLEERKAPALQLGKVGKLGLTGWLRRDTAGKPDRYLYDARFDPMVRRKSRDQKR